MCYWYLPLDPQYVFQISARLEYAYTSYTFSARLAFFLFVYILTLLERAHRYILSQLQSTYSLNIHTYVPLMCQCVKRKRSKTYKSYQMGTFVEPICNLTEIYSR